MELEFWRERWRENQIGFHLSSVNPSLLKHWDTTKPEQHSMVLVPLCGKSVDMIWLANQGHHVLGVEISEIAIRDFFAENKLDYQQGSYKNFQVFSSGPITLLQGDFFELDADMTKDVKLVYDRAALVALPESMRKGYTEKIIQIMQPNTRMLLITMDYEQSQMDGPPFTVSDAEIQQLYSQSFQIESLANEDILAQQPRFKERGLTRLVESVHLLARRI